MPKPYGITAKGQAEYAIKRRATEWFTVAQIVAEINVPARAVRSAIAEMIANGVLIRNGNTYRYPDWKLPQ
jgi:hypothetical protein